MHTELVGVTLVLAFTGLLFHAVAAQVTGNVRHLWPTLVRLAIVSILVGGLESWGDMLVSGVNGLITDVGAAGGGNIFQDYQAAIALKMGTAAAAQNLAQPQSQSAQPGQAVPSALPGPGQMTLGKITHYAYPGDSGGDSQSSAGQGAFAFDTAPGSLIAGYSAALTPAAAQQFGVSPGQQFSITASNGNVYTLQYADVVPTGGPGQQPVGSVVTDIYDPNNALGGGNNFSESISSSSAGAQIQGQTGMAAFMPNPGGSIGDQIMWAITLSLSWIASTLMWFMQIGEQLLYLIEVAISPVFIGMLMIPALQSHARRFFLLFVGLTLWPFAWAVCDLVTKFLINLAVNPTGNGALNVGNIGALISGPLTGLAYLIAVAVWVIGSTLAAPIFIGVLLGIGGGTATAALFGSTLGAATSSAFQTANKLAGAGRGSRNGGVDRFQW